MDEAKSKKDGKLKKTVSSVIYYCVLGLLALLAVLFLFNRINNRITFVFNRAVIYIMTESMEPQIPAGTYILVERAEPDEVAAGDVITFYSDDPAIEGSLNTHRVVSITEGTDGVEFNTKGDNNIIPDSYTAKGSKLVGKYERNLTVLTAIASLFLTKTGLLILILAFAAYSAAVFIPEFMKYRKAEAAKKQAEFDAKVAAEVERMKATQGDAQNEASGEASADNKPDAGSDNNDK